MCRAVACYDLAKIAKYDGRASGKNKRDENLPMRCDFLHADDSRDTLAKGKPRILVFKENEPPLPHLHACAVRHGTLNTACEPIP